MVDQIDQYFFMNPVGVKLQATILGWHFRKVFDGLK
jgi:hypothetical protein